MTCSPVFLRFMYYYCSLSCSNYQIVGPLTMLPLDDEENYVMDARMLLYLPSDPPVLVIGTNNGRLYHCVLLMTNRDNVDQVRN